MTNSPGVKQWGHFLHADGARVPLCANVLTGGCLLKRTCRRKAMVREELLTGALAAFRCLGPAGTRPLVRGGRALGYPLVLLQRPRLPAQVLATVLGDLR